MTTHGYLLREDLAGSCACSEAMEWAATPGASSDVGGAGSGDGGGGARPLR